MPKLPIQINRAANPKINTLFSSAAKVYPPLNGTPSVTGNEDRLIKIAINQLWGHIRVIGKEFDTAEGMPLMTAFGALLDDKELAPVLTYVRNSWGNKAPIVTPQSVQYSSQANKAAPPSGHPKSFSNYTFSKNNHPFATKKAVSKRMWLCLTIVGFMI
ncbi:MAG: hypothetical protein CAK88_11125 [Verrucomicrobiia bacterium AMD-G2]|nr:MAG: hypothetical protein CAK88_11125 [Verrucomicrobiae bacterium AMD-G2]